MNIRVYEKSISNIDDAQIEVVERKGLGHPDTLSDMLADKFSQLYSQNSIKLFGGIVNHAVDKVTLLGAKSQVEFGSSKILKPITACLFGKASLEVEGRRIDVERIFVAAVREVFISVFRSEEILEHINYIYNVHDGIGFDHPKGFYSPHKISDVQDMNRVLRSNDSVICTGYAPYSITEILVIKIENWLNSDEFKSHYPQTGTDIKVLATRFDKNRLQITVCIPFIATRVKNMSEYMSILSEIKPVLLKKIHEWIPYKNVELNLNTKDEDGKYAYLTVFGSALDKGDQGAVGRGNRFNGIISATREMNVEAAAGKNPVHHSGKLYNHLAHNISLQIYTTLGIHNSVFISAQNGDILNEPSHIFVKTVEEVSAQDKGRIDQVIMKQLGNLPLLTNIIVQTDPIHSHIYKAQEK